jgi:hypothetical protein
MISIKNIIKSVVKWIMTDGKKNKSNMNDQEDMYVQNVKQQYFGKYFEWIRPINQEKPGDIVRCTNVRRKGDNGPIVVEFNAGSGVSIDIIANYLKPYNNMDNIIQPPTSGLVNDNPEAVVNQTINQPIKQPVVAQQASDKSEMFKMFSKSDMHLDLTLNVKMPDIALVKMMYNNAENKDKFLDEISEFVLKQVTAKTIKEAFSKIVIDETTIIKVEAENTPS